jgi:NADPH:quinone reductase-like Zn-dependent oxidoreductase
VTCVSLGAIRCYGPTDGTTGSTTSCPAAGNASVGALEEADDGAPHVHLRAVLLMRAVVMRSFGPPEVLGLEEIEVPEPAAGEARVRVAAVEVSRTRDVATRSGRHPFSAQVTLPHVLGGDCAGVVEAVGAEVDTGLIGRRVAVMNTSTCGDCPACRSGREYECERLTMLGIHRPGSYADLVVAPARSLHVLPDDLGLTEAAALAATGPIALMQLRALGPVDGGSVLVTGATGALAMVLTALAPRFGADAIGLTRRPALVPPSLPGSVVEVGSEPTEELTGAIAAASRGGAPVGAVDNVASPAVFDRYFPTLRNGARVVISGAIGGATLPVLQVPVVPLYVRSISLVGVRTATARTTRDFWDLVRDGFRLPPGLLHEMPLAEAARAHQQVIDGRTVGHTVLTVEDPG